MTHFDDADLFEAYYADPNHESIVLRHVDGCGSCGARFHSLESRLRAAADLDVARPEAFWTRQRLAITNRIERTERIRLQPKRLAAAAVLSFLIGGAVMYKTVEPTLEAHAAETELAAAAEPQAIIMQPAPAVATSQAASVETVAAHTATKAAKEQRIPVPHDAWQSDELSHFHSVVEWESWVESSGGDKL